MADPLPADDKPTADDWWITRQTYQLTKFFKQLVPLFMAVAACGGAGGIFAAFQSYKTAGHVDEVKNQGIVTSDKLDDTDKKVVQAATAAVEVKTTLDDRTTKTDRTLDDIKKHAAATAATAAAVNVSQQLQMEKDILYFQQVIADPNSLDSEVSAAKVLMTKAQKALAELKKDKK